MAGKQSQANKNFWYAYALWQQKVVQALARRRAEELARKRAEELKKIALTKSQTSNSSKLGTLALLLGTLIVGAILFFVPVKINQNKTVVDFYNPPISNELNFEIPTVFTIPPPFDPCKDHLEKIIEAITELARRAREQIDNYCKLWEISQGLTVEQPAGCQFAGTWDGHQAQMRNWKRNLRNALRAFMNSGRDGCPDENHNIEDTANAWLQLDTDALLPEDIADEREINQELPPTLSSDVHIPVCYAYIPILNICVPPFIFFLN